MITSSIYISTEQLLSYIL